MTRIGHQKWLLNVTVFSTIDKKCRTDKVTDDIENDKDVNNDGLPDVVDFAHNCLVVEGVELLIESNDLDLTRTVLGSGLIWSELARS